MLMLIGKTHVSLMVMTTKLTTFCHVMLATSTTLEMSAPLLLEQVAQVWLTDRATACVRKVYCAVVSTVRGSVWGETPKLYTGQE